MIKQWAQILCSAMLIASGPVAVVSPPHPASSVGARRRARRSPPPPDAPARPMCPTRRGVSLTASAAQSKSALGDPAGAVVR
jgi:hypothetical protein